MKQHLRYALIVFALLAMTAQAQHLYFKVGAGVTTHLGKDGARPQAGIKGGIGYEIEFDQHWTFSPSLSYFGRGWKDRDVYTPVLDEDGQLVLDEDGNPRQSLTSVSGSPNYIELALPFYYYFRIDQGQYIYVGAGPYLAVGVAGKLSVKGDGTAPEAAKYYYDAGVFDRVTKFNRLDAGLQIGAGYQMASGLRIGIEAGFGLVDFNRKGAIDILGNPRNPARNFTGLVTMAYHFDLGGE